VRKKLCVINDIIVNNRKEEDEKEAEIKIEEDEKKAEKIEDDSLKKMALTINQDSEKSEVIENNLSDSKYYQMTHLETLK